MNWPTAVVIVFALAAVSGSFKVWVQRSKPESNRCWCQPVLKASMMTINEVREIHALAHGCDNCVPSTGVGPGAFTVSPGPQTDEEFEAFKAQWERPREPKINQPYGQKGWTAATRPAPTVPPPPPPAPPAKGDSSILPLMPQ